MPNKPYKTSIDEVIDTVYCAFCDSEADYMITETETPICENCKNIYEIGKENQGTIENL